MTPSIRLFATTPQSYVASENNMNNDTWNLHPLIDYTKTKAYKRKVDGFELIFSNSPCHISIIKRNFMYSARKIQNKSIFQVERKHRN